MASDLNQDQQARLAYETLLANCCHYEGILPLLTQHRPYFESLPSIRRLQESMVLIPLPNVRSREVTEIAGKIDARDRIRLLPCDIALMVCDPEWQIKTGIEIVLFIQRPGEDFSDLINRWRQTQVELGQGVEWLMPRNYRHLLAEGTAEPHPLFVVFVPPQTPQTRAEATETVDLTDRASRIIHGFTGAKLPFATVPMGTPQMLMPVDG
ncbi:MAG: hypothetical protein AAFN12_05620 [Cyanobacteria bacterium J06560_2]